jgi:hypothetical protein
VSGKWKLIGVGSLPLKTPCDAEEEKQYKVNRRVRREGAG